MTTLCRMCKGTGKTRITRLGGSSWQWHEELQECRFCDGTGQWDVQEWEECETCEGKGIVPMSYVRQGMIKSYETVESCPTCKGRGQIEAKAG